MARINVQYIKNDIRRAANQYKGVALGATLSRFRRFKNEMIAEFLNHKVTQEIQAGPNSEAISGVLSRGNLFSFIGFSENDDPITQIVNVLEDSTILDRSPEIDFQGNLLTFSYNILTPTRDEIAKASPLPWQIGRSWALGIEEGISGVNEYLFHRYFPRERSRSTTGLQSRTRGMGTAFTPTEYITKILQNFKSKFA